MIKCPKCNASLPVSYTRCQFCGTDVSSVPRPAMPKQQQARTYSAAPAPWIVPTYYVVCCFFLLEGVFDLVTGLGVLGAKEASPISIVFGAVTILFAIGMMLKIDLVRGIANILLWIQIALGLLSLYSTIMLIPLLGPLGIGLAILCIIRVAVAGFMIFLIGETDGAPNF